MHGMHTIILISRTDPLMVWANLLEIQAGHRNFVRKEQAKTCPVLPPCHDLP